MRGLFASMLLLNVACASESVPLTLQPTHEIKADDYEDILKRWTRRDTVYNGLDSKLFANATFHSPEFPKTYAVRFPRMTASGHPVISSATHQLILRMSSALGQAKLIWNLTPTGELQRELAKPPAAAPLLPKKEE